MMYYNSMCLMRQYLAVSFACIGIYFLSNKKKYLFLIFTLIGISFHSSTIVVLIMYFIMKIKPSKKIRIKIVLISLISFIAFDKIIILLVELVPKYATYINSQYYLSNKLSVYLDVIILLMIFIFKYYVFFKYQNDDKKLRYNWYCIEYYASMMALIIGVFSIQGSILGRVGIFFEVINCITIANSLSSIKNQKHKYILSICILSFAIIYNFVILIFRPYWSGVIPYSFWS